MSVTISVKKIKKEADFSAFQKIRKALESISMKEAKMLILSPSCLWPLVAFGSIFIFDNSHNILFARTMELSLLLYPLYLLAIVIVGALFFRMVNKKNLNNKTMLCLKKD